MTKTTEQTVLLRVNGGDANDLAMLAAPGRGISFHGKPVVAAAADA